MEPTPDVRLVATPETMLVELEIYSVATKRNQTFEPAIRWSLVMHYTHLDNTFVPDVLFNHQPTI